MGEDRKWLAEGQNGAFEPLRIFEGTPREAAIGFPANLNVAVALSFVGIGADRMTLEILGRPLARTGTCTGSRSSRDSASFSMSIEDVPSDNPKKGRITALSVISYLRKLGAPLRVGS